MRGGVREGVYTFRKERGYAERVERQEGGDHDSSVPFRLMEGWSEGMRPNVNAHEGNAEDVVLGDAGVNGIV